ncbi:MAG: signal peptidase II [Waltera sp.]
MTVVCLVILAGIFWGDFFLKNYIESHENERDERVICKGKFLIRKHHNKGMMLNAGRRRRLVVVSLAFTLILTVVFIVSLGHRGNNLLRLGLALLLGGAFSNTYDRLRRGYVVDYVSFPVKWQAFRKIVFNCSDFCIIIGALLSALGML